LKITQHNILAVTCATLLLTLAFAPASANPGNNDKQKGNRAPRNADTQSEAPTVSRSEAAAIAERATSGRVLSVREDGRYWQVKVLVDEKRVRFVSVDMRSGAVR